jgi:hypothetical protein
LRGETQPIYHDLALLGGKSSGRPTSRRGKNNLISAGASSDTAFAVGCRERRYTRVQPQATACHLNRPSSCSTPWRQPENRKDIRDCLNKRDPDRSRSLPVCAGHWR